MGMSHMKRAYQAGIEMDMKMSSFRGALRHFEEFLLADVLNKSCQCTIYAHNLSTFSTSATHTSLL